jgi:hypothetical protein
VVHGRDGEPELGIAAVLTPDGERAWAHQRDPATLVDMEVEEFVGRVGVIAADGTLLF